jgi:DNA-binding PadR family transcriptional regulator
VTYAYGSGSDPFERIPYAIQAVLNAMSDAGRGRHRHGGHRQRPHHRDVPFGRDFPFGGGSPFGRGRKARRGDVRAAALVLLDEEPRNGYQLMQEIEQRSDGAWRPSPGSVYPALQQLEDEGLVRTRETEGRREYELTPAGTEYVEEHRAELGAPWEAFAHDIGDETRQAAGLLKDVAFAAAQVLRAGDEAQLAQARAVLADAKRSLYLILAGDDEPDANEG